MRRLLSLFLTLSMALAIQGEAQLAGGAKPQKLQGSCCPCEAPPASPDCCPPPSSPSRCPSAPAPLRAPAAPAAPSPILASADERAAEGREPRAWTVQVARQASLVSTCFPDLAEPTGGPPGHRRRLAQLGVFRI